MYLHDLGQLQILVIEEEGIFETCWDLRELCPICFDHIRFVCGFIYCFYNFFFQFVSIV